MEPATYGWIGSAADPNPNPNPNIDEYSLNKLEKKWADNNDDQIINNDNYRVASDRVKQETNFIQQSSHHNQHVMYNTTTNIGHGDDHDDNDNDKVAGGGRRPCWMMPIIVSSMSPNYSCRRRSSSCDTSTSSSSTNNIYLDFSANQLHNQHPILDRHSIVSHLQCSDTSATSRGASKKARLQPSSTQHPPLRVRKEKLGDRITALHQLISPFGKKQLGISDSLRLKFRYVRDHHHQSFYTPSDLLIYISLQPNLVKQ